MVEARCLSSIWCRFDSVTQYKMRMWCNGSHAWFRARYQRWCMGSTPFIRTNLWRGSSVVEHLVEAQGVSGPTPLLSTNIGLWQYGNLWWSSSVGRAPDWRSGCHWFDSSLHHQDLGEGSCIDESKYTPDTWSVRKCFWNHLKLNWGKYHQY